jgi:hypothetical protein
MSESTQVMPGDDAATARAKRIAFDRNYCEHYAPSGANYGTPRACKLGIYDRTKPCIRGHELPNPLVRCEKWERRSIERATKRADDIELHFARMVKVGPVVAEWRKKPWGKAEVIECPACGGRLHLSQARSNGHVHGKCETQGCVSWME